MHIGQHALPNRLFVAPMAGVTDRPFRQLCRKLGAGYAVSEMVTSKRELWASLKTSRRADHAGEAAPIAVQIAGVDPHEMADAARCNIDRGAQIIDINMGCPAKKVCNAWAGSALMSNEPLAQSIIAAVVAACSAQHVPVTLKMRTGRRNTPQADERNAVALAHMAQGEGVAMITVHGRTREQGFKGLAEYDTIAAVKAAVAVPVVANGDVDSPEKARDVLRATGADALMIGRAAQGRPWIFREIDHFLRTGEHLRAPTVREAAQWFLDHLLDHYALYGEFIGVRSARKHIGWALATLPGGDAMRQRINAIESCEQQWHAVRDGFDELAHAVSHWPHAVSDAAHATNATHAASATALAA